MNQHLNDLQSILNLSQDQIKYLLEPKSVSQADLEVDGKKFPAWRVLSSRALGPGKGGLRFQADLNLDKLKDLAFIMSLKTSLLELPYGGAKGGVKIDSKNFDTSFLEKLSRAYLDAFSPVLGPNKDILGPDLFTDAQVMAWILDQYEEKNDHHQPDLVTGKPPELGGLSLRDNSTAYGAYLIFLELIKILDLKKENLSIAIQGCGKVGSNMAKTLEADNFKILAINDSRGGVFNSSGLNISEVLKFKEEYGLISSFNDNEAISQAGLLEGEVDVLILSALENQITKDNVDKIKAKYIIEIANNPISYEADKALFDKGVVVLPDILVNSAGVVLSYFEWSQNRSGHVFSDDYWVKLLENRMKKAWHQVYNKHLEFKRDISLRSSAYLLALERIIKAEKLRGRI